MNETRITLRKVATGTAFSLVGFIIGGLLVRAAARHFAGSPAWVLPAIICGALALFVVAALVVAPAIGSRPPKVK